MAYGQTLNPNRRAATLIAVSAIHLAAGYALVVGLAGHGFITIDPHLEVIDLERVKPKLPPPTPQPTIKASEHAVDPFPQASPIVDLALPSGGVFTPIPVESYGTGGTGIETAAFPTPIPQPLPSFAPVGPKPRGNPGLWVTPNDYPTTDLRLDHAGVTAVALRVGRDGRVEDCAVTRSSGYASLDSAACAKILQRARFSPGSDSTGVATGGHYTTSVKWEIPE